MYTSKTGTLQTKDGRYRFFKTRKLIGLAAVCIMVFSLWCGLGVKTVDAASVFQFSENQLTSNSADQTNPDIYQYGLDNWAVVWQDKRNGNWDIYMCYQKFLGAGKWDVQWDTRITANRGNNVNPQIYNDIIVYQSDRNSNWDIYMYNLTSKIETQITADTSDQSFPAIYGDIIVWQDWRNVWRHSIYLETYPGMAIYMYNLTSHTEQRLALPEQACFSPSISGDSVVYIGENYLPGTITFMYPYVCSYNLSTGQKSNVASLALDTVPMSYQPRQVSSPVVDGSLVAWSQCDADLNVVVRNMTAASSWVSGGGHQYCADVSGKYVVYQSCSNGSWIAYYDSKSNWDITLYDSSSGLQSDATAYPGHQINPAISTGYANFIVYQDNRNGNWDIYLTAFWYGAGAQYPPLPPITPSRVIGYLEETKDVISQVPNRDFWGANNKVRENRRNALLNQLDSAIAKIEAAANSNSFKLRVKYLQSAIGQLDDLSYKLDGWSLRGKADVPASRFAPDWITSPLYLDQAIRSCRNDLQIILKGMS